MSNWKKVEAALFASGKYMSEEQISNMTGLEKKDIAKALKELKEHYDKDDSSLNLFHENAQWKLNVKEDYTQIVRNVVSEAEMAVPIMETLAVIAYKTPILQSDVIKMRGSGAYDHIKILEEKGFIAKEKTGRTYKIKVVDKFFEYFDIEGESKIGEMFKDVIKPDPSKLGDLQVYNSKENQEENDDAFHQQIIDRMQKVENTPEDEENKGKFLEDFEDRIEKAKVRIDTAEQELSEYKRAEPEEDEELDDSQEHTIHSKTDDIFGDKEESEDEKEDESESESDDEDESDEEDDSEEKTKSDSTEDMLKKVNSQIDDLTNSND